MADNIVDTEERRLLDDSLPNGTLISLWTVSPTDAGGGTEFVGNAYARQAMNLNAAATAAGVTTKTGPTADVLFPAAAPAAQGTVVALGFHTAAGVLRWVRPLTVGEQRTVNIGDQYKISAAALSFGLS